MKRCNDCGKELPDDSEFCQYCGSKNISSFVIKEEKKAFKRCIDCGKELPIDSDFCQYCGSKRVAIINNFDTNQNSLNTKKENKYRNLFVFSLIIAICSIIVAACYVSMYNNANDNLSYYISENESLENELENTYVLADNFNTIKNTAGNLSNTNFFATQTVLKNPNNTRVVFYIPYSGNYTINWSYSYGITATTGNTSSGLVYLDITYNESGVGTIECTNNINSSKITIYCIGTK